MDINKIINSLENCPCGRKHILNIGEICIKSGALYDTAKILSRNNFPRDILLVCDKNTLSASDGIEKVLEDGGYNYELMCYNNLRTADICDVRCVSERSRSHAAILSVGTGSLNDICRLSAYWENKPFAIFATAPSMDGFASGTAPITENNFKTTREAVQPDVIIADTAILAASPKELKAAGFGDMMAKYIALCDWRISHLLTGEYYCENIASITKEAVGRVASLCTGVGKNDEETAGAIMESLILTGLAMKLCDSVRPASGAEHIVSHFWEIKKLEHGMQSDYHGKKVGVATLFLAKLYHDLAENETLSFGADKTDWQRVYSVYGDSFALEIRKINSPTITDEITPVLCEKSWQEIRRIIKEELPDYNDLRDMFFKAGAATTLGEISVREDLGVLGLKYHPYMRHRMTLTRLIPMMSNEINFGEYIY